MTTTRHDFVGTNLAALAVHGSLTTRQVQLVALPDSTHRAVHARLIRMRDSGLLLQLSGHMGVTCWSATERARQKFDIELPAVTTVGAATARHGHVVSEVVIAMQQRGEQVTTERQIRQAAVTRRETAGFTTASDGKRVRTLPDGSRVGRTREGIEEWFREWTPQHLPDLCVEPSCRGGQRRAVEVELNAKLTHLIDQKLRWYQSQRSQYGAVLYLCGSPSVERAVRRAADRTGIGAALQVSTLTQSFLDRAVMP